MLPDGDLVSEMTNEIEKHRHTFSLLRYYCATDSACWLPQYDYRF